MNLGEEEREHLRRRLLSRINFVGGCSWCWDWVGARQPKGYGLIKVSGRAELAHRIAYLVFKGPIPHGNEIDHLCRRRPCINPEHLEAVTPYENFRRGESPYAQKLRQTHCVNGHPFAGRNVVVFGGGRHCRECSNRHSRNYKRRVRLERESV